MEPDDLHRFVGQIALADVHLERAMRGVFGHLVEHQRCALTLTPNDFSRLHDACKGMVDEYFLLRPEERQWMKDAFGYARGVHDERNRVIHDAFLLVPDEEGEPAWVRTRTTRGRFWPTASHPVQRSEFEALLDKFRRAYIRLHGMTFVLPSQHLPPWDTRFVDQMWAAVRGEFTVAEDGGFVMDDPTLR